jgi:hypothetical protein
MNSPVIAAIVIRVKEVARIPTEFSVPLIRDGGAKAVSRINMIAIS